ncbi:MarR family EPS-associated transcriptional regulator [Allopusillimonas ginsengisoli]|nr:MarR family EPS-associated transcriptional regulator [Allopusillimonas ginsengisoli]TEA77875.1 MarR family EPS-associated transcriptional regulator [Allopusillimonas ginsengisoli]
MLSDENHLKLLRLLEENPDMSQRELSRRLGISLGKTNYCLKELLRGGLIKIQNFKNSHNKLAYAYLLTPAGVSTKAELTLRFLKIKVGEYKTLKAEIEQLQQEAERFTAVSRYSSHINRSHIK